MFSGIPEVDVSEIPSGSDQLPYVLDVREEEEWDAAHIEGAHHMAMMEVPARLAELPTDQPVLVICRSGSRSARVVGFLQHQGIDAANVAGGMQVWSMLGRPMAGPPGQEPQVI